MKFTAPRLDSGWFPPVLLLAGAFLLFANTFGNAWTYDDFPVIVHNPDVRSWGEFLHDSYPGRPLRELSFLLDYAFFGYDPRGWHLQSILWHGVNAILVFALAGRLGLSPLGRWGAALVFLAHPLQVETVANISHRKESLAAAFSLFSLHAWITAFEPGRSRPRWVAAALGLGAVALLGKETAVVLPAIFCAYEFLFVPPERRLLARSPRLLIAAVVLAASGGALWLFVFGGGGDYVRGMSALMRLRAGFEGEAGWAPYVRMVLKSWGFLLEKVVCPTGLALEYTWRVPEGWGDRRILTAVGALGAAGIFLSIRARRYPAAALALVCSIAFFLPVSNLWPLAYFAADRYLYTPLAGVALLAGLGLSRLGRGSHGGGVIVLVLLTTVLGLLTYHQNAIWRTPVSLWSRAVAISPEGSFALNNLGWLYLEEGDEARALELLEKAARNRWNPNPQDNLAWFYERRGERAKAVFYYLRFLQAAGGAPDYRERSAAVRNHLVTQYGVSVE